MSRIYWEADSMLILVAIAVLLGIIAIVLLYMAGWLGMAALGIICLGACWGLWAGARWALAEHPRLTAAALGLGALALILHVIALNAFLEMAGVILGSGVALAALVCLVYFVDSKLSNRPRRRGRA